MGKFRDFFNLDGPAESAETRGYAAQPTHDDLPRAFAHTGTRRASSVNVNEALGLTAVYRCVSLLSTLAGTLDLEAVRVNRPVALQPPIVRKPNIFSTRRDFIQETVTSMALFGESFWLLSRASPLQTPDNMEVLHPSQVNVRRDLSGRVVYDLAVNGKWRTLAPYELQHLKKLKIPGSLHGVGPLQSCQSAVRLGLDQEEFAGSWFGSTEVPEGVLTTDQPLTKEQAQQAAESWQEGRELRRTAVLGNGLTYATMSVSPRDALFVEASELSTLQICRLFGVPGTLLDVPGDSNTYANQSQKNQALLDYGLRDYLDEIESAYSVLLPLGTSARFKTDELLALDESTRAATDAANIASGMRSAAELRERDGLDPLPESAPVTAPALDPALIEGGSNA